MYEKDFTGWHKLKAEIDGLEQPPTFKEREVWWTSIGVNVGSEIDGKNAYYHRPVIIVRKFSPQLFWAVPTTTKIKENPYYLPISYTGKGRHKEQCVILSHLRLYDSKRLHDKMGRLSHEQFAKIKDALKDLL